MIIHLHLPLVVMLMILLLVVEHHFLETHAPATNWSEQSYSSLKGNPGAVTFHQNRLWYGGTIAQPDGLWASKSNEFFNFDIGKPQ